MKIVHIWKMPREFIIGSTSSGKTAIPLICYEADKIKYEKKVKLLYIVPYRALATQKAKEFKEKMGHETVIVSTSEYCSEDINVLQGNCDIAIVIYEKVYMFLSKNKHFLDKYSYIVFDELGIVENLERGLKADYILYAACLNPKSNIYVLATPYFNWKEYIERYQFNAHQESERPIKIEEEIIPYKIGNEYSKYNEIDEKIVELCKKHREMQQKILVFSNSRTRVKELARKIYEKLKTDNDIVSIGEAKKNFFSQIVMSEDDLFGIMEDEDFMAYEAGIAYHNAALPEEIRELIEKDYLEDNGKLDIVVSTETLAYGLNSNVDVVIVSDMEKTSGGEKRFLSVNEYENYIGRAGRLGKKAVGYAYTFIPENMMKDWNNLKEKIENPDLMESQYKIFWKQSECIFHLLNYFDNEDGIEEKSILQQIQEYPYIDKTAKTDMENELKQLQNRKLISYMDDDFDELEKYRISSVGTRALGFIICVDTYDKLINATKSLFKNDQLLIFDFLYTICQCKEIAVSDYYSPHEANIYLKHMTVFMQEIHDKNELSFNCKKSITDNRSIKKFRKENNKFSNEDWNEIKKVRMAEALYLWINSYSIQEIQKICGFEYSAVKKMGEKAKYITDILSADISSQLETGFLEMHLKNIGIALYYGIRIDILNQIDETEIEPIQGRQLRTIGRIINIQKKNSTKSNQHKLKMLLEHVKEFPKEYVDLIGGYNIYDK